MNSAERPPTLLEAAIALREAQKAYMADRGNDELGKKVAAAAARLDEVIYRTERGYV